MATKAVCEAHVVHTHAAAAPGAAEAEARRSLLHGGPEDVNSQAEGVDSQTEGAADASGVRLAMGHKFIHEPPVYFLNDCA
jgi:hypothetical protein